MPRYAKQDSERWLHPTYRKAYCFRYRNGMVYTSINSVRQATGIEWLPKNKRAAMQLLHDRLIATLHPKNYSVDGKTIRELILQFHKDKVAKLDDKTKAQYRLAYKQFFDDDYYLSNVLGIREHILQVKNESKLSSNTLWKRLQRLKRMFDYAVELEWMDRNPITKSMVPTYVKKEVIICSDEHIKQFIEYFNSHDLPVMALMVEFAYLTAMRIQEILDLQWDSIKDDHFIIFGKGKRKRLFVTNPFPRVKEILSILRRMKLEKPFPWRIQTQPARYVRKAAGRLSVLNNGTLDFDGISFHVFRKTAINRWRNAGIDTETRNLIAGHSKDVEKIFYLTEPAIPFLEGKLQILSK